MVEPPFHVGQSNRFHKLECSRFGCAHLHRDQAGEGKPASSLDCLLQLSGRLHGNFSCATARACGLSLIGVSGKTTQHPCSREARHCSILRKLNSVAPGLPMNRAVVGQPSWLPVARASLPAEHLGGRDAARTGRLEACPTCLPRFMAPTHVRILEVFPTHEPYPPHPVLLPQWGRRCPEGG